MQVFTSVSINYLPKARLLAETLRKQHPEAGFHLVLSDRLPDGLARSPAPFDSILHVEELPIPRIKGWIFQHTLVELCTAVKGAACRLIMDRHPDEPVLYLDPDMVVLSRLDELLDEFRRADVLLTPHLLEPELALEAVLDNEVCALRHGVYNLGFLGVAPTAEGRRFVQWWTERLRVLCYDEIDRGLFTDQRWADLVPAFFPTTGILRHPGYNVATWNLSRRQVTGTVPGGLQVNGRPLCFFHFSGFDSGAQKAMLDKFGARNRALYKLRDWYVAECRRLGQEELGATPWAYDCFQNGEPVTVDHRRLYRDRIELQEEFPDPFSTAGASRSYYHWYREEMREVDVIDPRETLWRQLVQAKQELARIRNSRTYRAARRAAGIVRATWLRRKAA